MNTTISILLFSSVAAGLASPNLAQEKSRRNAGSRRPVDVSVEGLGEAAWRAPDDTARGGRVGLSARRPTESTLPLDCVGRIADQATGGCLIASSTPTLGVLYPYPGLDSVFVPPAFVGGGEGNLASGPWSTVGGGRNNTASGDGGGFYGKTGHATVGGGYANTASGYYATVGGGGSNTADDYYATVAGGAANTASDYFAAVGGGKDNTAGGHSSAIAGGLNNQASGRRAAIGGGQNNSASGMTATVGGGDGNSATGSNATIGGGGTNTASGYRTTVGGGTLNEASGFGATAGGGHGNTVSGIFATIAGGAHGRASGARATIGGGDGNSASGDYATVAGGGGNEAPGYGATVGGGGGRTILVKNSASGSWATVPGGTLNAAQGNHSFAAGRRAKANHDGAFVWGDGQDVDKASSVADEFNVYASGGVRLFTNSAATSGVLLAPGGSTWTMVSDRDAKENVEPVDARAVLEKVARLPLATWNYEAQDDSVRHMGPMAQDFHAAFGLGLGHKTIDTIDPNGVALAAIQGLHELVKGNEQRLAEKDNELEDLRAANADLRRRLERLEARMQER